MSRGLERTEIQMPHARSQPSVSLETLLAASEAGGLDDVGLSLLLFECGNSVYGVEASAVEAIDEAGVIAPLPHPLGSVEGVASVRGSMRLVIRLGSPSPNSRGRLVALSSDRNIAIHVDRVIGVVSAGVDSPDSTGSSRTRPDRLHIDGLDITLVDPMTLIGSC